MRAVIMDAPGQIKISNWQSKHPDSNEVMVKVNAAGICAGDMYIYQGKNPYVLFPAIGGHEISGVVSEVGVDVHGIEPGTPVVVVPFIGCGTCYPCRMGKSNCCANLRIIGVHQPGGFAEYVTAPSTHIHPVPRGLSPVVASFAEPVAIGVQSCRRGEVSKDDSVLVLGCGPIGLAIIEVAKARGATVWATDIDPKRTEFAATLGATILPSGDALIDALMQITNGEGAPVVIEATGNAKVMESTLELVAAGGRIVIVGLVPKGKQVSFPGLDFTRKEVTLVGSRASVNCFPEALELLANGLITYPKVATEFSMWDAPDVFAELNSNPGMVHKGVLVI